MWTLQCAVLTAGFALAAVGIELLVPPLHPAVPGLHPIGVVQPGHPGRAPNTTQRRRSPLTSLKTGDLVRITVTVRFRIKPHICHCKKGIIHFKY